MAKPELVTVTAGGFAMQARFEWTLAPATCAAFCQMLPYRQQMIHTSHPAPGEILFHPGGFSETEILFPYGACLFSSKLGQLAGNHFLTIVDGREQLRALGEKVLWAGAQEVVIR
jgi:hypothetical protein